MKLRALAAAAAVVLAGPAAANITLSQSLPTTNWQTAKDAEIAFLNTLGGLNIFTENFEDLDPTKYDTAGEAPAGNSIETAVGTFTQIVADPNPPAGIPGLRILNNATNAATSNFSGRRDMTNQDGSGNWLDGNDSPEVEWKIDFSSLVVKLGFFLTDVNDQGAKMTAVFEDETTFTQTIAFPTGIGNGRIIYVTALFHNPVKSVIFNSTAGDGWGIDDITVAAVPLPAGVLLLGLGLGGLAAYRRRQAA